MSAVTRPGLYALALTVVAVAGLAVVVDRDGGEVVGSDPPLTVVGADRAEMARLDKALERFRLNELDLPPLEVRFGDDPEDCGGHPGGFRDDVRPWQVLICSELDFVITHELAHAWCAANLDDAERQRYLDARGLPTWDDHAFPWSERGTEDAAFVIQQNLMIKFPRLQSPTWQERAAAYELLTGQPSPFLR